MPHLPLLRQLVHPLQRTYNDCNVYKTAIGLHAAFSMLHYPRLLQQLHWLPVKERDERPTNPVAWCTARQQQCHGPLGCYSRRPWQCSVVLCDLCISTRRCVDSRLRSTARGRLITQFSEDETAWQTVRLWSQELPPWQYRVLSKLISSYQKI